MHVCKAIDQPTQGSKEEEEGEDKEKPLPLLPSLKALLAAWRAAAPATATQRAQGLADALKEALQPGANALLFNIICGRASQRPSACTCFNYSQKCAWTRACARTQTHAQTQPILIEFL